MPTSVQVSVDLRTVLIYTASVDHMIYITIWRIKHSCWYIRYEYERLNFIQIRLFSRYNSPSRSHSLPFTTFRNLQEDTSPCRCILCVKTLLTSLNLCMTISSLVKESHLYYSLYFIGVACIYKKNRDMLNGLPY